MNIISKPILRNPINTVVIGREPSRREVLSINIYHRQSSSKIVIRLEQIGPKEEPTTSVGDQSLQHVPKRPI